MTPDLKARLRQEEVCRLYRMVPPVLASNVAVSGFAAWGFWGLVPSSILLPWVTAHLGLTLVRGGLVFFFKRVKPQGPSLLKWGYAAALGSLLSGALWGSMAHLLYDPAKPITLLFAVIFICGMVAGSIASLSWHLLSFWSFSLTSLMPISLRLIFSGDKLFQSMGFAGIVFILVKIVLVRRLREQLQAGVLLGFENLELVDELKAEKRVAEEASRFKSRFLAAASHDLRQPVHALGLYTESLGLTRLQPPQRRLLSKLASSSKALLGMLESLLDLSKAESAAIKPETRDFPLKPLFSQIRKEFEPAARRQGQRLKAQAPALWLRSDEDMLGRILRNLLSNALRHGGKGQVKLLARREGKQVVLSVEDEGQGIPQKHREEIFGEFVQLGNPERDRAKGLGLGLSIVRGLCQQLGHPLKLQSVPELKKGSRFSIRLPLGSAQRLEQALPRFKTALPKGARVLVIDDDADSREGLKGLLSRWGLAVDLADSLESALSPGRNRPTALLCDFRLRAGATGIETLAALRKRWGAGLKGALLTGDTGAERLREVRECKDPVLFKPVPPARLRALLHELLGPS